MTLYLCWIRSRPSPRLCVALLLLLASGLSAPAQASPKRRAEVEQAYRRIRLAKAAIRTELGLRLTALSATQLDALISRVDASPYDHSFRAEVVAWPQSQAAGLASEDAARSLQFACNGTPVDGDLRTVLSEVRVHEALLKSRNKRRRLREDVRRAAFRMRHELVSSGGIGGNWPSHEALGEMRAQAASLLAVALADASYAEDAVQALAEYEAIERLVRLSEARQRLLLPQVWDTVEDSGLPLASWMREIAHDPELWRDAIQMLDRQTPPEMRKPLIVGLPRAIGSLKQAYQIAVMLNEPGQPMENAYSHPLVGRLFELGAQGRDVALEVADPYRSLSGRIVGIHDAIEADGSVAQAVVLEAGQRVHEATRLPLSEVKTVKTLGSGGGVEFDASRDEAVTPRRLGASDALRRRAFVFQELEYGRDFDIRRFFEHLFAGEGFNLDEKTHAYFSQYQMLPQNAEPGDDVRMVATTLEMLSIAQHARWLSSQEIGVASRAAAARVIAELVENFRTDFYAGDTLRSRRYDGPGSALDRDSDAVTALVKGHAFTSGMRELSREAALDEMIREIPKKLARQLQLRRVALDEALRPSLEAMGVTAFLEIPFLSGPSARLAHNFAVWARRADFAKRHRQLQTQIRERDAAGASESLGKIATSYRDAEAGGLAKQFANHPEDLPWEALAAAAALR